jgi:hypothetical protein
MKKNNYLIIIVLAACSLASCKKDYLDVKKIPADMPVDLMYKRYDYIQGIVWNAYSYLPDGFAWVDMEAATDDAYHTNVNNRSHTLIMACGINSIIRMARGQIFSTVFTRPTCIYSIKEK